MEQLWAENSLTVEGNIMHERAHTDECESRGDVMITRGLRICSRQYGICGQTDIVEFRQAAEDVPERSSICLPGRHGRWVTLPVEYKRGKPKISRCDEVQLCAQVLCLEEMLDVAIDEAAFFYGKPRRRLLVNIDDTLRSETINLIDKMHELYNAGVTPREKYGKKCMNCSLYELCQPKVTGINKQVRNYISQNMSNRNETNS